MINKKIIIFSYPPRRWMSATFVLDISRPSPATIRLRFPTPPSYRVLQTQVDGLNRYQPDHNPAGLFNSPVPADSRDLRPCLIAKTFVLAFQPSLPTHPYKVALAPLPLGVLDKAAIKRA